MQVRQSLQGHSSPESQDSSGTDSRTARTACSDSRLGSPRRLSVSDTQLASVSSSLLRSHLRGQLRASPSSALRPSRSAGSMVSMKPEMKLKMQRLLRQNAGVLRQDASSIIFSAYNVRQPEFVSCRELDKQFSAVAIEMLREQEDRDLHPYGRGGRFEGVLYSRRVKVQVDHAKFLAWIVFAGFILLTSGAIIFLAEMERRQKSHQMQVATQTPMLLVTANGTTAAMV